VVVSKEVAVTEHVAERTLDRALRVEAAGWGHRARIALEALDHLLRTHFRQTEGSGGLFEDVMERAPHLMHELESLRAEHVGLRAELDRAIRVSRETQPPVAVESEEESIHGVSRSVAKHLDREDDLVWRTYDVDLRGGGR
jgi:hypothetical protein